MYDNDAGSGELGGTQGLGALEGAPDLDLLSVLEPVDARLRLTGSAHNSNSLQHLNLYPDLRSTTNGIISRLPICLDDSPLASCLNFYPASR